MRGIFLSSVAVLALLALDANAASSVSDTGQVKAKVVVPVTVTHTANSAINFGTIVNQAQDVSVSTTGERTGTNVIEDSNTPTADEFTVAGPTGVAYTIQDPGSTDLISGSNTISVNSFVTDPAKATSHTLSGSQTVRVGATAHLTGDTVAADDYAGTYTLQVNY